jgi:hypothetical protein
MTALSKKNVQSAFKATGLVPYDPEQVLSRLNTQIKTPTPPWNLSQFPGLLGHSHAA